MLLNHRFDRPAQGSARPVLVFLHGLFGDMNNLGVIARAFADEYPILRADLRNHGRSFHSDEMSYQLMAQDVITLLEHLNIRRAILIGHSMGGKTAMTAAAQRPDLIEKLVVIDIAPVDYNQWHNGNEHAREFEALFALKNSGAETRQQARPILERYLKAPAAVQFLLKAFDAAQAEKVRFFTAALYANYRRIMGWQPVRYDRPTLFIKGGESNYIQPEYTEQVLAQFPQATSFTINGAHHWVHAEKPDFVIRAIARFLR